MFEEMWLASNEIVLRVDVVSITVAHFPKGVDVELADEGGIVAMLEVFREDVIGESGNIWNDEGIVSSGPPDRIAQFFILP